MSATFDFNPFAASVELWVRCPRCGRKISLSVIPPTTDLSAENHSESCSSDFQDEVCDFCGYVFDINLTNGICGGDGTIENIPEENLFEYHDYFEEDDDWTDIPDSVYTDFLDPHVKDIALILDNLDGLDNNAQIILYRSLYAGVISAFEAYLSDTLISKIMKNEGYKIRFVRNSKKLQNEKFNLSDFYDVQSNIDNIVIERLREIIYHNLAVVSKLYKAVLNVDFPQYTELATGVSLRHDIVHRNGKDKSGKSVVIKKEDVQALAQNVSDFIKNIESQIYQNENPEEMKHMDATLDMIFSIDKDVSSSNVTNNA